MRWQPQSNRDSQVQGSRRVEMKEKGGRGGKRWLVTSNQHNITTLLIDRLRVTGSEEVKVIEPPRDRTSSANT